MSEKLFESEFPAVSSKEWIDKIVKDLRGKPYKNLNWWIDDKTYMDPFYTIGRDQDLDRPFHQRIVNQLSGDSWKIIQDLSGASIQEIEKAIESDVNVILLNEKDNLLDIDLIYCEINSKQSLESINIKYPKINLITNIFRPWISGINDGIDLSLAKEEGLVISFSGSEYHNAGASDFLEMALLLASINEYLHHIKENNLSPNTLSIEVSMGINFYSSIAKTRAMRILIDKLLESYSFSDLTYTLNAKTSSYYNAHKDQYSNLLRHTTMALSAVLGSADGINVSPFENKSPLAYRLSRNIQHLLKEEAYMDKVEDMTAGSYFFEELTITFIDRAWEEFRKIEKDGGFIASMKSGDIKSQINEEHLERVKKLDNKDITMIGVNKFLDNNEEENKTKDIEIDPRPWVLPKITLSNEI